MSHVSADITATFIIPFTQKVVPSIVNLSREVRNINLSTLIPRMKKLALNTYRSKDDNIITVGRVSGRNPPVYPDWLSLKKQI